MPVSPSAVEDNQAVIALEQVGAMLDRALARVDRALPAFVGTFPAPSSELGLYPPIANIEWTNGFWTGILWLAHEASGRQTYRTEAEATLPSFVDRIDRRIVVDHHDLGFLYTLSCCAAHQLTGDGEAQRAGIVAAELLLSRFDATASVIQAWGDFNDPAQRGRMIIDCNLNLPLLWWASSQTGDPRFAEAANRHVAQAARYLVRPDHSTYHTFYMDTQTGEPRFGSTHQGFADDSAWARGQAWGIYGFALAFRHTGDPAYLDLAARLADYFLARLPADGICYWDLIFTDGDEPRDSSAAAIAACGLLELSALLPLTSAKRAQYGLAAARMLVALDYGYLAPIGSSNGILDHAVYHWPNKVGVDECCIWGDYFYMEGLVRLQRAWKPYWA